jgi:hypothetical protein
MATFTGEVTINLIEHKGKLPINPKVLHFALKLGSGTVFPPIKLDRLPGGRFQLVEGRNRLAAAKLVGRTKIKSTFAVPEDPYPYKHVKTRD